MLLAALAPGWAFFVQGSAGSGDLLSWQTSLLTSIRLPMFSCSPFEVPVPDIRAHMQKRVDKAKASWNASPCQVCPVIFAAVSRSLLSTVRVDLMKMSVFSISGVGRGAGDATIQQNRCREVIVPGFRTHAGWALSCRS